MNKAGARSLNLYSKALRITDFREQRLLSRRPWGKGGVEKVQKRVNKLDH